MPVVFVNSREETPVDQTNLEELTAWIVWVRTSIYGEKAQNRVIETMEWTHPSDRDNAIADVRRVESARERARACITAPSLTGETE